MRRQLTAMLLTSALVALAAGPASASAAPAASKRVTGPVSGTEIFEFSANGCSFVYQEFHLTVAGARPGTLEVTGCVIGSPTGTIPFTFVGTFVYTAANGATLTGTASGPLFASVNLDLTLTPTSGTKQLKRSVGAPLRLISRDFFPSEAGSTLTGTLEAI